MISDIDMQTDFIKPEVDDRLLFDIIFSLTSAQSLYVAHDLHLFALLSTRPMTLTEVCDACHLKPRAAQALLSMCAAQKLLRLNDENKYELTRAAAIYLVETSPTYLGGILDQGMRNSSMFTFESLKKALLSNSPQVHGGKDLFKTNQEKAEEAEAFTRCMHSKSMGAATAWPEIINLSTYRCLLDVGGGSGAHSIGGVSRWPNLRAIIYDLPNVCRIADRVIAEHHLTSNILAHEGNMWDDPFPEADVHFYSDIFHDWPPEKCLYLARKSFQSLMMGGCIIVHEMLFDDDKTGPWAVAAYNMRMMQWAWGQQFSGKELTEILETAGFCRIEIIPTGFGYWRIVTGIKTNWP